MMNSQKDKSTNSSRFTDSSQKSISSKRRCQFCGREAELVWVHGHGQCAACGINAEECCRGETCG